MMLQPVPAAATNVSVRLPTRRRPEPSRQVKLEVVPELLAALDTATTSGQHYVMDRIIDLLGQEASRTASRVSDWQRQSIMGALAELVRQAARLVPDEAVFRARAGMLTDVLRVAG